MATHFVVVFAAAHQDLSSSRCFRDGRYGSADPIKNDSKANDEAIAKVRADKEREAGNGHDGTCVAPLVWCPSRWNVNKHMTGPNQLSKLRED